MYISRVAKILGTLFNRIKSTSTTLKNYNRSNVKAEHWITLYIICRLRIVAN